MSSYILMHSGETYYNGKRKSNKKDFMYKTFTETSSIGLKGETKTIKYYKEDELFHCFDGNKEFVVDREGLIDRKVKNEHSKGKWGNNKEFTGIISHSAKGQTWSKHKYIRIENGRYIYPEDLKKNTLDATSFYGNTSTNLSKTLNNKTGGTFTALKFKTTKSKEDREAELTNAMNAINSKYKGTMNCTACTAAIDYLIRNKNRNIKIDVPDFNGASTNDIRDLYRTKDGKKPEFTNTGLVKITDKGDFYNNDLSFYQNYNGRKTAEEYLKKIVNQGDGARGHMIISFLGEYGRGTYQAYGSHDIMYSVKNGKVYILDAQSNEMYPADKFFNRPVGYDAYGAPVYRHLTNYLRTDDLDINYKNEFYKDKLAVGPERAREHNIVRQRVKKSPKEVIDNLLKKLTFKNITKTIKNLGKSFIKALFNRNKGESKWTSIL